MNKLTILTIPVRVDLGNFANEVMINMDRQSGDHRLALLVPCHITQSAKEVFIGWVLSPAYSSQLAAISYVLHPSRLVVRLRASHALT